LGAASTVVGTKEFVPCDFSGFVFVQRSNRRRRFSQLGLVDSTVAVGINLANNWVTATLAWSTAPIHSLFATRRAILSGRRSRITTTTASVSAALTWRISTGIRSSLEC
jgi:hypothetical protein